MMHLQLALHVPHDMPMNFQITRSLEGHRTLLRLSGRIQGRHVDEIRKQMGCPLKHLVFDLTEVTLVDLDVVRFLALSERAGAQVLNCARYIREWVSIERNELEKGE